MDNPDTSPFVVQPPDFPRFGIRHLLLWAVCLVAVAPPATFNLTHFTTSTTALLAALSLVRAVIQSAAVMALPLLVFRRWRGSRFPVCPGERYWLIVGIGTVIWLILMAMYRWGLLRQVASLFVWQSLLAFGLNVHAAWRVGQGPWRWFFIVEAVKDSVNLLPLALYLLACVSPTAILVFGHLYFLRFAYHIVFAAAIPVGLCCVVLDHRRGRRYPWTHWWGVGLLLASAEQVLWLFVKWS